MMINQVKEELQLLEKEFSVNNYRGISGAPDYVYIEGTENCNILLSIPHCLRQIRDGDIKKQEEFTGAMGKYIAKKTGCHLIHKMNMFGDANYDEEEKSEYKRKVREIIEDKSIRFFIDIHGMPNIRNIDICIATDDGNNINNTDLDFRLINILKQHFPSVSLDDPFDGRRNTSLVKWVNEEFLIPALQIKFSDNLCHSDDIAYFTQLMTEFIDYLNKR